jgi:cob(I)alamin adenosyltransferase
MSIATRTGDDGTTSLLYGQRVPKHHPQIEAVGACDELNASLGVAKAACVDTVQREQLTAIQHALVALMGEVACAESDRARYETSKFRRLAPEDLQPVDAHIAELESRKLDFKGWATPGENACSAALEVARTAARRAERRIGALSDSGCSVRPLLLQYLNRISDLLWLMARAAEKV